MLLMPYTELPYETTDWLQIGKGVRQGCILSPYLFNLYAEYIMRNAGLDEAQAEVKLQYFSHLLGRTDSLEKILMLGEIEGRRRRG